MRKRILILILTLFVLYVTSCYGFAVILKDGPYDGRVIDVDSGEPIEGVVVLGVWNTEIVTPGGATHNFYNAQETVSDKNGDFRIKGMGFKILSNITPMDVLIFKAGYEFESGSWSSLKKYAKRIKWDGNRAIIPLRKLTMEERRKRRPPIPPTEAPLKNIRQILEEINKNEIELGAEPYDIWRGEKVHEQNNR